MKPRNSLGLQIKTCENFKGRKKKVKKKRLGQLDKQNSHLQTESVTHRSILIHTKTKLNGEPENRQSKSIMNQRI